MIVSAADLRAALGTETADDTLLARLSAAAEARINALLGYDLTPSPAPAADLVQAIYLLAGHWYENREASLVGVSAQEIPQGVWDIVNEHREWTFGEADADG